MPALARASGADFVISAGPNLMLPERDFKIPITVFSSVVLPTPFRPIKQVHDPSGISRSRSQSVWLSP
jgi:hypothetical protein